MVGTGRSTTGPRRPANGVLVHCLPPPPTAPSSTAAASAARGRGRGGGQTIFDRSYPKEASLPSGGAGRPPAWSAGVLPARSRGQGAFRTSSRRRLRRASPPRAASPPRPTCTSPPRRGVPVVTRLGGRPAPRRRRGRPGGGGAAARRLRPPPPRAEPSRPRRWPRPPARRRRGPRGARGRLERRDGGLQHGQRTVAVLRPAPSPTRSSAPWRRQPFAGRRASRLPRGLQRRDLPPKERVLRRLQYRAERPGAR